MATTSVPVERATRRPSVGRIRVAQVVTKFTTGAGGMTLEGALALDPGRYSTTIVAAAGGSLAAEARARGVRVVSLRHMAPDFEPWEDAHGVRELTRVLADERFDVVHTHSAKAGALGRMAARRVGVPAVLHSFHGFPFHEFQSPQRRASYLAMERRLARLTDYFMAAGTMVAAEAVRLRIAPPERIRAFATVPIGAGIAPVSEASRAEARRALGVSPGTKVIGTVARLDAQKSPGDLVRAIASLGRTDVVVVWLGDGELRGQTERLIETMGLRDRFRLLGHRTDVADLLPGLDVFAMPSLYEGLPCAVVEAMICGVPVVATAVNSVPEIVLAGKTGILARPGDPVSLARAIAYLLDHPGEAARMARAAAALVGERFRPETLGVDLMEAYEIALRIGGERRAAASGRRGRG